MRGFYPFGEEDIQAVINTLDRLPDLFTCEEFNTEMAKETRKNSSFAIAHILTKVLKVELITMPDGSSKIKKPSSLPSLESIIKFETRHCNAGRILDEAPGHIKAICDLLSEYISNHPEFMAIDGSKFNHIDFTTSNYGKEYTFSIRPMKN